MVGLSEKSELQQGNAEIFDLCGLFLDKAVALSPMVGFNPSELETSYFTDFLMAIRVIRGLLKPQLLTELEYSEALQAGLEIAAAGVSSKMLVAGSYLGHVVVHLVAKVSQMTTTWTQVWTQKDSLLANLREIGLKTQEIRVFYDEEDGISTVARACALAAILQRSTTVLGQAHASRVLRASENLEILFAQGLLDAIAAVRRLSATESVKEPF